MIATEDRVHHGKHTKVERYGWTIKDKPGRFLYVNKRLIEIDPSYQRQIVESKVKAISANWSWVAFGAATVARRPDGSMFAMDAQHRIEAAKRRADIEDLPCMVFDVESVSEEAEGFLSANTLRRPLTGIDKHRAKVMVGESAATSVEEILKKYGYQIASSFRIGDKWKIKAVVLCENLVAENKDAFDAVIECFADCLGGAFVHERVLSALFFLHSRGHIDIRNRRTREAISRVGFDGLLEAIHRASAYYARGSTAIFAEGVSTALNKGRRNPISTLGKSE